MLLWEGQVLTPLDSECKLKLGVKTMRVVSMVPSWTETLLKAGIQVVGRTRYCVHPPQMITNIPIVGGTKDVDWRLVQDLRPDIVLLDQEENPLEMAEECPLTYIATHVNSVAALQKELERLAEFFENAKLMELSIDCYDVLQAPKPSWDHNKVPGFLQWVAKPSKKYGRVVYVIWKKPWMGVSKETYIGSVLEMLGAKMVEFSEGDRYPVLEIEELDDVLFLFSSEPFPFVKKVQELRELGLEGAIVDGECYSWFGLRSLEFLKAQILGPPV